MIWKNRSIWNEELRKKEKGKVVLKKLVQWARSKGRVSHGVRSWGREQLGKGADFSVQIPLLREHRRSCSKESQGANGTIEQMITSYLQPTGLLSELFSFPVSPSIPIFPLVSTLVVRDGVDERKKSSWLPGLMPGRRTYFRTWTCTRAVFCKPGSPSQSLRELIKYIDSRIYTRLFEARSWKYFINRLSIRFYMKPDWC